MNSALREQLSKSQASNTFLSMELEKLTTEWQETKKLLNAHDMETQIEDKVGSNFAFFLTATDDSNIITDYQSFEGYKRLLPKADKAFPFYLNLLLEVLLSLLLLIKSPPP